MMYISLSIVTIVLYTVLFFNVFVDCATKSKPHGHKGALEPYNNKHISYNITYEQNQKLNAGEPITINTRNGKSGRGIVIQDVNAPPNVVMDRIRDLKNYPKMVPHVNKIDIYSDVKHTNGTIQQGAEFNVGVSLMSFGYYLILTFEPKYNTLTWTLDYRYNSDFDDNTGHWQVMPHPTKADWSRVLYSTEVKLFSWIPEFVVTFLTKTALIEANTWVKKESEKEAKLLNGTKQPKLMLPDVSACFISDKNGGRYHTHCAEGKRKPSNIEL